jgi:hypothetical protein
MSMDGWDIKRLENLETKVKEHQKYLYRVTGGLIILFLLQVPHVIYWLIVGLTALGIIP